MTLFKIRFLPFTLYDVIDILVVASLLYVIFQWLKGSRSIQMILALLFLAFAAIAAEWGNLHALGWIMSNFKTIGIVAIFIVFQPEIRSALTKLGGLGPSDIIFKKQRALIPIDDIVESAFELSKRNLGGLIVVTRRSGLKEVIDTGKPIDAHLTPELLVTLFTKNAPLHDGAAVVKGDRIVAAGCVLPLLSSPELDDRRFGMRHRAGMGIASESDAIVIIISEESGQVSVCCGKDLIRGLSRKELRNKIEFYLNESQIKS
jgi:diadenylate cyclase